MAFESGMDRRNFLRQAGRGAAAAGLVMAAVEGAGAEERRQVERADPHAPKTGRLPGGELREER